MSMKRTRTIAGWYPPTAAAIVVAAGLIIHEIAYHLTGGSDYPLTVLAGDTRVLAISHGGLDTVGAGALIVVLLSAMDVCQAKVGRAG